MLVIANDVLHQSGGAHVTGIGCLVGPGVLDRVDHLEGLHALAERVGVAVVNTWGAKGVFRWDSPYHGGTAGLQARDFELAGLGEVEVLITSGIDPDEVTSRPWDGRAEVIDVHPGELARFARRWDRPAGRPERPRLYSELAAVIGPMYADPASPPARARALAERLPAGGRIVAPPGLLGYWVARTLPTTEPGSVVVPARGDAAEARALAAELASRAPVVYVSDVAVEVPGAQVELWDDVELSLPSALLDVAGPIVAWG
jgi:hypothetical protein